MEDIRAGVSEMRTYPDISSLLKKKANRRQRLARLSFEEKIDIVNKWRELSRQTRRLRLRSLRRV